MPRTRKIFRTIAKIVLILLLAVLGLIVLGVLFIWVSFTRLNQTNGAIVTSSETRNYLLYVPPSYDPSAPAPLVLSFHGFIEWPAHQMQISGWNALADEYGFIVVYPEGTSFPRRWRAGGFGASAEESRADVQFISGLIDELSRQYNIDPHRIYANGLSNGAGMSYALGCELSDRIAAVGGVAGAYVYPLEECDPSRPVPMIVFHGTADPIVPYLGGEAGGPGGSLPDISAWVAARAGLNGCDPAPAESAYSASVTQFVYSGCDQAAAVVFYSIAGGGHTWPGGEPLPEWLTGPTSQEIEATRVMWEFFQRFTHN